MQILNSASALGREFLNDPADPVVGLFFYGISVKSLSKHISERKKLKADEIDKIWHANKEITLSTISTISSAAIVLAWLEKIRFVTLGIFQSFNTAMSWVGGGVISAVRCWEAIVEFDKGIFDYYKEKSSDLKKVVLLKQIERLVRAIFLACFAGWGLLSMAHIFIGGASLFFFADRCFAVGLATLGGYLPFVLIAAPNKNHGPQENQ